MEEKREIGISFIPSDIETEERIKDILKQNGNIKLDNIEIKEKMSINRIKYYGKEI